jgi:DNA-binding NarL/FixJ family response regulator
VTRPDAEQGSSAETRLTTDCGLQLSQVGDVIVISADVLALPDLLSESEQAVARALIAGSSNAEIARARGTSVKTVANQLYAMYRKLGVSTREELVARLVDGEQVKPLEMDDPPRS